ncbi:hypothetical protein CDD83_6880 [Cordyceps sp. RAO-2017]|nr:hypothetical protein CDD83_6880 [Cordyceps sp. RAO-2017]
MYDATGNIFSFANGEFLWRAKVAILVAAIAWTIPLAALVAPSTLTIVPSTQDVVYDTKVPVLDFRNLSTYHLSYGNVVAPAVQRIVAMTSSAATIPPMRTTVASNASYTIRFYGPSLKCDPATGLTRQFIDNVANSVPRFLNTAVGASMTIFPIYLVFAPAFVPLANSGDARFPPNPPNLTVWNYTALVERCIFGVSKSMCIESWPLLPPYISFPFLLRAQEERLACSIQNTSYVVTFRSDGDHQTTLHPSTFQWEGRVDLLYPEYDGHSTRTNYSLMAEALTSLLSGIVVKYRDGGDISFSLLNLQTQVMETALIGALNISQAISANWGPKDQDAYWSSRIAEQDRALARNMTLGPLVEELSRNVTLGLFSDSRFWSKNGTVATVKQVQSVNRWHYQKTNLWLAYSIAISAASFSVLLGIRALRLNRACHDTSFSSTLATTRNATLDQLFTCSSLVKEHMDDELLKTKLLFGVLKMQPSGAEDGDAPRVAFGLPEEITKLQRGQAIVRDRQV